VTEQIDAMRALGNRSHQETVTPRVVATVTIALLPDHHFRPAGLVGGKWCRRLLLGLDSRQYWTSAWQSLGVARPDFRAYQSPVLFDCDLYPWDVISACLSRGGTRGLAGRLPAVVVASVMIWSLIFCHQASDHFIGIPVNHVCSHTAA